MRTSRIARETSKLSEMVTSADHAPRRHTRAFAAKVRTFEAADHRSRAVTSTAVKREVLTELEVSMQTASQDGSADMEDLALYAPSPKRRRTLYSRSPGAPPIQKRESPRKLAQAAQASPQLKREKRTPAKRITNADGEIRIQAPSGWEEVYGLVREMRKDRTAPVDTMGCETLAQAHMSERDKRFQTLIALMLSSQTKDTTNAIAMKRLQTELPSPGLTLENILEVDSVKLNDMIYVVGFHNTKTRHIKAAAEILRDQFNGDIPDTIEGLMSLPGVGPKMGYLCLSAAWGKTEGIGVDVHVHRITNLWRWHNTKTPEETRLTLQGWLPRQYWHEINHLLVGFGQTICTPVARKCEKCVLGEKRLCPSVIRSQLPPKQKAAKLKVQAKVEVEVKTEGQVETRKMGEIPIITSL